jgi:hypothetical protein
VLVALPLPNKMADESAVVWVGQIMRTVLAMMLR